MASPTGACAVSRLSELPRQPNVGCNAVQVDTALSEGLNDHRLCPVCPTSILGDSSPNAEEQSWDVFSLADVHLESTAAFQLYADFYNGCCLPLLAGHQQLQKQIATLLKVLAHHQSLECAQRPSCLEGVPCVIAYFR